MLEKLLPCPMCGEDSGDKAPKMQRSLKKFSGDYPYFVECGRCGLMTGEYRSAIDAEKNWNMRTKPKSEWVEK